MKPIFFKALLSAAAFEEELGKMKAQARRLFCDRREAFYRARHSSIIDAMSGTRLDVRRAAKTFLLIQISNID